MPRKFRTPTAIASLVFGGAMLASMLTSTRARAEDPPPKKPIPNYDGREPAPPTAGEIALWIPRVVLYPLYLLANYGFREPIGALDSWAERHEVPKLLYDFFAFGPDHKIGIAPVILFDFGFEPSVGVYFFWNDAITKGNNFNLHASTWGDSWLAAGFVDRYQMNKTEAVSLHLTGIERPDNQFYGTGARSILQDQSRYTSVKFEAGVDYFKHFSKYTVLQAGIAERHLNFYNSHFDGNPNIEQSVAAGRYNLPEAYETGYTAEVNHLRLDIDSRGGTPTSTGSGVRVELEGEQGEAPDTNHAWIRYDAVVKGMLDLFAHNRILALSAGVFFSDPLGEQKVPFTELVAFGGFGPMTGFLPGRLYGRSGFATTLQYHWPIWMWLTGSLQASLGNVFDTHLEDFKPNLLRFSSAIGFSTLEDTDNPLEILVGIGSETFAQGATIDSFRIMVGTTHGY